LKRTRRSLRTRPRLRPIFRHVFHRRFFH
jgi:hypothetical protein